MCGLRVHSAQHISIARPDHLRVLRQQVITVAYQDVMEAPHMETSFVRI